MIVERHSSNVKLWYEYKKDLSNIYVLKWPSKDVSSCSCVHDCADTRGSPCKSAKWRHHSRCRRWVRSTVFISVATGAGQRTLAGVLMFTAIVTPNCSKNQRTFLNLAILVFTVAQIWNLCTRDLLDKIPFKILKIPSGRPSNFKLNVTIKHCQKILPPLHVSSCVNDRSTF